MLLSGTNSNFEWCANNCYWSWYPGKYFIYYGSVYINCHTMISVYSDLIHYSQLICFEACLFTLCYLFTELISQSGVCTILPRWCCVSFLGLLAAPLRLYPLQPIFAADMKLLPESRLDWDCERCDPPKKTSRRESNSTCLLFHELCLISLLLKGHIRLRQWNKVSSRC